VLVLGLGASSSVQGGLSLGDTIWDTQFILKFQAAPMITAGLYGGYGLAGNVSESDGQLSLITPDLTSHWEGSLAIEASGTLAADFDWETGQFCSANGSPLAKAGRFGEGYGAMLGWGPQFSATLSSDNVKEMAEKAVSLAETVAKMVNKTATDLYRKAMHAISGGKAAKMESQDETSEAMEEAIENWEEGHQEHNNDEMGH